MKGNEAIGEASILCGADAYYAYPITPQSEIVEYLTMEQPEKRTGMVVLQAESEIASINMVYGAAAGGKKAFTTSSSPGMSLMQEGLSYLAGAEIPCVVVNVVRGGPGLGTIQPSQADYFQTVKGGGHGDYKLITLAPASVQEMADFVPLAFDIAFKYLNPVMILTDGIIGQMMEKVQFPEQQPRLTDQEIADKYPWATVGRKKGTERTIVTSLRLKPELQENFNLKLQAKYREVEKNEVRYEKIQCEDAEYLFVAYGSSARICQKAIELARAEGIKVGLFRPISLYPYPYQAIDDMTNQIKGILSIEMSAGQMIEDVRLAVNGKVKAVHYGRMGGMIATPGEIVEVLKTKFIGA